MLPLHLRQGKVYAFRGWDERSVNRHLTERYRQEKRSDHRTNGVIV